MCELLIQTNQRSRVKSASLIFIHIKIFPHNTSSAFVIINVHTVLCLYSVHTFMSIFLYIFPDMPMLFVHNLYTYTPGPRRRNPILDQIMTLHLHLLDRRNSFFSLRLWCELCVIQKHSNSWIKTKFVINVVPSGGFICLLCDLNMSVHTGHPDPCQINPL